MTMVVDQRRSAIDIAHEAGRRAATLAERLDQSSAESAHRQLMAAVWGPTAQIDAQFVRVLVGQVRQKIEEEPAAPKILMTEAGLGYRLIAEDEV